MFKTRTKTANCDQETLCSFTFVIFLHWNGIIFDITPYYNKTFGKMFGAALCEIIP